MAIDFEVTKYLKSCFFAEILSGIKNNGKKGALCSSLFISRKTSSASTDISSFCIKGLKYFIEPVGSCKSLSRTVSYLARSCMIERKLPLLFFESSLLDQ